MVKQGRRRHPFPVIPSKRVEKLLIYLNSSLGLTCVTLSNPNAHRTRPWSCVIDIKMKMETVYRTTQ